MNSNNKTFLRHLCKIRHISQTALRRLTATTDTPLHSVTGWDIVHTDVVHDHRLIPPSNLTLHGRVRLQRPKRLGRPYVTGVTQ